MAEELPTLRQLLHTGYVAGYWMDRGADDAEADIAIGLRLPADTKLWPKDYMQAYNWTWERHGQS